MSQDLHNILQDLRSRVLRGETEPLDGLVTALHQIGYWHYERPSKAEPGHLREAVSQSIEAFIAFMDGVEWSLNALMKTGWVVPQAPLTAREILWNVSRRAAEAPSLECVPKATEANHNIEA